MFSPYPARAQTGIYLLLAISVLSIFSYLLDAISYSKRIDPQAYGAGGYMKRFQPLVADLPAGVREMGYVTDITDDPGDIEFQLSQYVVAPVLVEKGAAYRYVIGNMLREVTPEFLKKNKVKVARTYPAGVVLFEQDAAQ